ncbi:MAG: hypothetical protein J2P45_00265 [Candidatus Dormibacteraeota bacterium]|nr:hypothetical protein [Candidatus Dormibacteraeota bacterium]
MNEFRSTARSPQVTRIGLSRAALAAAIATELEEAGASPDAEAVASAVAAGIEANNAELLRQLNQVVAPDTASAGRGETTTTDR